MGWAGGNGLHVGAFARLFWASTHHTSRAAGAGGRQERHKKEFQLLTLSTIEQAMASISSMNGRRTTDYNDSNRKRPSGCADPRRAYSKYHITRQKRPTHPPHLIPPLEQPTNKTHGLRFLTIVCVTSPAAGGSTFTGNGDEYGGGPPPALGDVSSSDTSASAFASGEAGKSLGGITLLGAGGRANAARIRTPCVLETNSRREEGRVRSGGVLRGRGGHLLLPLPYRCLCCSTAERHEQQPNS